MNKNTSLAIEFPSKTQGDLLELQDKLVSSLMSISEEVKVTVGIYNRGLRPTINVFAENFVSKYPKFISIIKDFEDEFDCEVHWRLMSIEDYKEG